MRMCILGQGLMRKAGELIEVGRTLPWAHLSKRKPITMPLICFHWKSGFIHINTLRSQRSFI